MAAKKTISKVKSLNKKVVKELRKKKPDFAAIETHLSNQAAVIAGLHNKITAKLSEITKEKKASSKKVKPAKEAEQKKKK
jgi:hypothetical protein